MRLFRDVVRPGLVIWAVATGGRPRQTRACTVEGDHVQFGNPAWDFDQDVIVRPVGGKPFHLTYVSAVRLRVDVPLRSGDPTKVEVHSLITFTATTAPLTYLVSREVETADGMVRLYPSARITRAASQGSDVVGSILVREDEALEPVRLPCDVLAMKVHERSADREPVTGDGTWWKPKGHARRFMLRARPDDHTPAVSLVVRGGSDQPDRLSFKRLSVAGRWTQIAREGFRVVAIGWARTRALEQLTEAPSVGGSGGGPVPGVGYHGYGGSHDERAYLGPAHVAVGTTVFAGRGTQPWARVENDGVFLVLDRSKSWVRVLQIPGIDGLDVPAFVPAAAVKRGR